MGRFTRDTALPLGMARHPMKAENATLKNAVTATDRRRWRSKQAVIGMKKPGLSAGANARMTSAGFRGARLNAGPPFCY